MNALEQRYKILSTSLVGIEFEFYSDLPPKKICRKISQFIGKKVIIPIVVRNLKSKERIQYHSNVEPTSMLFKLERDFSGGEDMFELVTGPLTYDESRIIIIKVNQWIKNYGKTTDKCAIHLNVSFDSTKTRVRLMDINILKFILSFDENFIYERFPHRKDSVYAKSINNFYPVNKFVFFDNPKTINRNEYIIPIEKYYGVNFTKLPKDYLELRYLGGKNYENRTQKILEILDYYIETLYYNIENPEIYTKEELERLNKKLTTQKKSVQSFSNVEQFLIYYPNIYVTVDLKGSLQILKTYWTTIREILFELISNSSLKSGHLNLDTDISIFQLRNGVMKRANHIKGMELFQCEISGTISHCDLYDCKINSSRLTKCKLIDFNEISNSKLEQCPIRQDNELTNCYIENPNELIEGKIHGGVIRAGIIGENAEISPYTIIVNSKRGVGKKGHISYTDIYKKNS